MNAKHTEGPWERVDTADYAEIHPKGKRLQSAIALVGKESDADLIAAAPELFAFVLGYAKRDPVFAKGIEKQQIADARALVAKAVQS